MSLLSETLAQVRLGDVQSFQKLSLHPLLGDRTGDPDYLLLDEALQSGCASIGEVSDEGSVPELRFDNRCEKPVLLLDGEELIGAKQNRILNLSVLAPAGKGIVIPVSCVESGRWRSTSSTFASAKRAHFSKGRASKMAQVSRSMRSNGTRRSDQSEVWSEIAEKAHRMDSFSETDAAAALYERHRSSLDDYRSAFSGVDHQVGAVFMINGKTAGFELFDAEKTLASLLPKLIESYALDAIDSADDATDGPKATDPAMLLEAVASAEIGRYPAIGLGEDWRITAPGMSAAALVHDTRIVHLCAFAQTETGKVPDSGSRLTRASRRRRLHSLH